MIFTLHSVNVVYHVYQSVYVEPLSASDFIMVYDPCNVLLNSLASILLRRKHKDELLSTILLCIP